MKLCLGAGLAAALMAGGTYSGLPGDTYSYRAPDKRCDVMGPDLHPWGLAFNDPPMHIDD
jgi:hypothetical protein